MTLFRMARAAPAAARFDDICKENNVSRVEQALPCKELWNLNNGVSICYSCHKDIEIFYLLKQTRE
jgi:hypothetical protein